MEIYKKYLRDHYKEFLLIDYFKTFWMFLANHCALFGAVLNLDWRKVSKPIPFMMAAMAICALLTSYSIATTNVATWDDAWVELSAVDYLSEEEYAGLLGEFLIFFGIDVDDYLGSLFHESLRKGTSKSSRIIKERVGSIEAEDVAEYLKINGHRELSLYIINGASEYEKSDTKKIIAEGIGLLIFPLIFLLQVKLLHKLLKCRNQSVMITLYVCLYCFGFSLPIQKIIEVIGWQIFQNQRYGNLFVGLLYLIFTYKFYKIFNFTHEVSFGRWFGATFIVGSIAGISFAIFQGIISFIPIGLIFFND